MSTMPPLVPPEPPHRTALAGRLRNYLITGLLALAPSAITLWVLYKLLNWVDFLLGRYIKFSSVLGGHRIPGVGIIATFVILLLVGWLVTMIGRWLGGRPLLSMWDHLLGRIPGVGLLYGSTKSFGEAFVSGRGTTFKQVVLVPWPAPGVYRVGFVAGRPSPSVQRQLGEDIEVVFVPHTPNPASGFVHYFPKSQVIYLDWRVEEGLKVIVSGGVLQPGVNLPPGASRPAANPPAADPQESFGAPRSQ